MKNETQLKWPSGVFTHTDFAKENNKTNQQVWIAWSTARKNGIIVSAGTKPNNGGKGKPSLLFRLASVVTVAAAPVAVASVIPSEPIVVPAVTPTPAPVVAETPVVVVTPEVTLPEVTPAVAPVIESPIVAEAPTIVEVVKIEPQSPVIVEPVVSAKSILGDTVVRTLTENCPICNHPLSAVDDATGVMVWCSQTKDICPATENPFGHSRNDKEAYLILLDKFARKSAAIKAKATV